MSRTAISYSWRLIALLALLSVMFQLCGFLVLPVRPSAFLFGDEREYWNLSNGEFMSNLRPPGYPVFIAFLRNLSPDTLTPILVVQSVVVAMIVPLLFYVLCESGVPQMCAFSAALLGSLSFTALSLPKRLLADSPLAILTLAATAALLSRRGAANHRAWLAGTLAALGLLLKPIFVLWVLFAPAILFRNRSRAQDRPTSWRRLALIALAPCSLVWLVVAVLNANRSGHPRYSDISRLAVVRYWVPATLTLEESEGRWDADRIEFLKSTWTPTTLLPLGERWPKALATLRARPFWAGAALTAAAWRNLPRPFFPNELGILASNVRFPTAAWLIGKGATYCLWASSVVGLVCLFRVSRTRPLGEAMLLLTVLFVAAGSISHSEGARLVFPVEWCVFGSVAGLFAATRKGTEIER